MLFVPSALAAKHQSQQHNHSHHHHHRCHLPEQLSSLQQADHPAIKGSEVSNANANGNGNMPLKFNVTSSTAAAAAVVAVAAAAGVQPAKSKASATTVLLKEPNNNNNHMVEPLTTAHGNNGGRGGGGKAADIVEAMRQLDAKLVAYLAGDDDVGLEEGKAVLDNVERGEGMGTTAALDNQDRRTSAAAIAAAAELGVLSADKGRVAPLINLLDGFGGAVVSGGGACVPRQLDVFRRVSALRLQMEALTLQPAGSKYMELQQNEIRPVFTVECQLSHELIRDVPRSHMFHVMQFESQKFHSLTQCTRFGQEAQREVRLALGEVDGALPARADWPRGESPFGRIRFAVWWREPGTCLNEMLGMAVLELEELYQSSALEKCKSIQVCKRGVHFASLYFKISLLQQQQQQQRGVAVSGVMPTPNALLPTSGKQCIGGGSGGNGSDDASSQQPPAQATPQEAKCAGAAATAGNGNNDNNQSGSASNNGKNNNNDESQLESCPFATETSKVRLLKGFICASETRDLLPLKTPPSEGSAAALATADERILVCRRFWHAEAATAKADEKDTFNYQEHFSVINDEKFLQIAHKSHLRLELWQRSGAPPAVVDDNGNRDVLAGGKSTTAKFYGHVQLPLHHFYIAFKDAAMAGHVCKGKMPVISIDAWVPIFNAEKRDKVGELKCLLAIGSDEQISNLKTARGLSEGGDKVSLPGPPASEFDSPTEMRPPAGLRKTSELMEMLQGALSLRRSVDTPITPSVKQPVELLLEVRAANNLPPNPVKRKKGAKRRNGNGNGNGNGNSGAVAKRSGPVPNEAPSTYVTFQAESASGKTYKSHEGQVYATSVVENCCQPKWEDKFRTTVDAEYLMNPEKCFVLKVWRKTASNTNNGGAQTGRGQQPTPLNDAIVGFVALNLTAFQKATSPIDGWFDIFDFNGRANGQLNVRCQPYSAAAEAAAQHNSNNLNVVEQQERPTLRTPSGPLNASQMLEHLQLGQAIDRQFNELEDISQRLRSRLADVTGQTLSQAFDMTALNAWQPMEAMHAEDEDNGDWDEFEHDINNSPPHMDCLSTPSAQPEPHGE